MESGDQGYEEEIQKLRGALVDKGFRDDFLRNTDEAIERAGIQTDQLPQELVRALASLSVEQLDALVWVQVQGVPQLFENYDVPDHAAAEMA